MWAKLFFWAFVAVVELEMLSMWARPTRPEDVWAAPIAMAVFPFIAMAIRKYRRWLYVRNHTVFVRRAD